MSQKTEKATKAAKPTKAGGAERTRRTADERRDDLIEAAMREFARTGLQGTAVSAITDAVGITQPYAFSLFRSKKGLFLAAGERMMDRFEEQCRAAAESAPEGEEFEAIKQTAGRLVTDPTMMPFLLQWFAASGSDEVVRAAAKVRLERLLDLVQTYGKVDMEEARAFFATGMLCAVSSTLEMPDLLTDAVRAVSEDC